MSDEEARYHIVEGPELLAIRQIERGPTPYAGGGALAYGIRTRQLEIIASGLEGDRRYSSASPDVFNEELCYVRPLPSCRGPLVPDSIVEAPHRQRRNKRRLPGVPEAVLVLV